MKVHPTADRILIKQAPPETVSKGGIIIPQTAQEKALAGTVVEVGPEVPAGQIIVGNDVMYDKYAAVNIKVDGEDHVLVRYPDILTVISE
jgi:chaperonin GroES